MSMGYSFHTFQRDSLQKLLGKATGKQKAKFVKALTDPSEYGDLEDEELERQAAMALEVLESGVSYDGKNKQEAIMLDGVTKMLFHDLGLGKEIQAKPISYEPMHVKVAAEVSRVAKLHMPRSALTLFNYGRRLGESEATPLCGYIAFSHAEVVQMHEDVTKLLGDDSIEWSHPDFKAAVENDLLAPLTKAMVAKDCDLYASCT